MQKATASQGKTHFGEYLDRAQREPVVIEKSRREVAVLIALENYRRFERVEDEVWGEMALAAKQRGMSGDDGAKLPLDRLAVLGGSDEE